jgi:hypothetical protein
MISFRDYLVSMKGLLINVEKFMEWDLAEETVELGENPPSATWTTNPIWPDLG